MIEQILKLQEQELDDLLLLKDWLPPVIFDVHVHTTQSNSDSGIINDSATTPAETFNSFDWPLHCRMIKTIFPQQKYIAAAFGFPHLTDWKKDNDYILRLARRDNRIVPIFRATAVTNPCYIRNGLIHQFAGLKMYPTAGQKKTPTKIIEAFPKSTLEIVNQLAKPIIVHLPNGLLANLEELITLAKDYPQAQFIIAHMGVTYCYKHGFETALWQIKNQPNLFFDTAMVSDSHVIAQAIKIIGPKRILFGSDAPFSYFRGGYVINPSGQRRLYSQLKFNWVKDDDRQYYKDQVNDLKLIHINIILAIKQALETLAPKLQIDAKNDIFYNNGQKLFGSN